LNEAILERVQQSGILFVSNAVIRGTFVMRACIVNFRTTTEDVDMVPDIICKIGKEIDPILRKDTSL
jgi:hypothetical protein